MGNGFDVRVANVFDRKSEAVRSSLSEATRSACSSAAMASPGIESNEVEQKVNRDGKGWPDTKVLPGRSFGCAANLETKTAW